VWRSNFRPILPSHPTEECWLPISGCRGRAAATRDEDASCPVSPTTLRSRSPTAPVRGETRQRVSSEERSGVRDQMGVGELQLAGSCGPAVRVTPFDMAHMPRVARGLLWNFAEHQPPAMVVAQRPPRPGGERDRDFRGRTSLDHHRSKPPSSVRIVTRGSPRTWFADSGWYR
jgi:hypothetical protein